MDAFFWLIQFQTTIQINCAWPLYLNLVWNSMWGWVSSMTVSVMQDGYFTVNLTATVCRLNLYTNSKRGWRTWRGVTIDHWLRLSGQPACWTKYPSLRKIPYCKQGYKVEVISARSYRYCPIAEVLQAMFYVGQGTWIRTFSEGHRDTAL